MVRDLVCSRCAISFFWTMNARLFATLSLVVALLLSRRTAQLRRVGGWLSQSPEALSRDTCAIPFSGETASRPDVPSRPKPALLGGAVLGLAQKFKQMC